VTPVSSRSSTARGPGRPTKAETSRLDDEVRRRALELFLDLGFERTSVEAIARAAGTTKASIYGRYDTKQELFRDVVEWAMGDPGWPYPEPPLPDSTDLETSLRAIAAASVRRALHPSMVKLSRLAISQIAHFPEIAVRSDATSNWWRAQLVADLLRRHAAAGEIVADEPEVLAEHFFAMVSGMPARLASMGRTRDEATQAALTRSAVDLFLRALRP
jgi:AcrR family transcriptional regulator